MQSRTLDEKYNIIKGEKDDMKPKVLMALMDKVNYSVLCNLIMNKRAEFLFYHSHSCLFECAISVYYGP